MVWIWQTGERECTVGLYITGPTSPCTRNILLTKKASKQVEKKHGEKNHSMSQDEKKERAAAVQNLT